jgi:uncharacterized protein
LSAYSGDSELEQRALATPASLAPAVARYPTGFGHFLCVIEGALGRRQEIAIVGRFVDPLTQSLIRTVFAPYLPSKAVAGAEPGDAAAEAAIPLLEGRVADGIGPAAYVCEHFVCQMPATSPEELARQLGTAQH